MLAERGEAADIGEEHADREFPARRVDPSGASLEDPGDGFGLEQAQQVADPAPPEGERTSEDEVAEEAHGDHLDPPVGVRERRDAGGPPAELIATMSSAAHPRFNRA